MTLTHDAKRFDTILMGMPPDTTMHRFVEPGGRTVTLPPSGVLLGRGLGNLLSIRTGDEVTITAADGTRLTERVAGFVDEPLTAVAYTSLDHLNRAVGRSLDSGALIKLRPGVARDAVTHRLGQLPGAAAYFDNAALEATLRDAFQIMDVLVGVMLLFAIVMAIALLYNAMSANLAERSVELGTLNAAGMSRGILGRLVATENLLLDHHRDPDRTRRRHRHRALVHVQLREPRLPLGAAHADLDGRARRPRSPCRVPRRAVEHLARAQAHQRGDDRAGAVAVNR